MRIFSLVSLGILIILGILGIAHYVVYEAIITIASLLFSNSAFLVFFSTAIVKGIFVFLWLSFAIAIALSMKVNNWLVRLYYRITAIWTGLMMYVFGAVALYGVVVALDVAELGNFHQDSLAKVGLVLVCLACVSVAYGLYNASVIRTTNVTIKIDGLPQAWRWMKAVWVSDVHLGHIRGKHFAAKVTAAIAACKPDVVFIGGDLYDGVKVDMHTIVEPFRALPKICPTFFIMGNHEEFNPNDPPKYIEAVKALGITVLEDEMVEVEGMQIIGVDHGHTDTTEKFRTVMKNIIFDRNRPSILLKHEPRDIHVAADAGVSVQLSGHTHHGQVFPVNILTNMIFRGFGYGLATYKRNNAEPLHVYTSSGVGTWGPPVRIGTKSEIVVINFN